MVDDLRSAGTRQDDPLSEVSWVTVTDVGGLLEATALRARKQNLETKQRVMPARIEALRPQLPDTQGQYSLAEFASRFNALVECIELNGELGRRDEAVRLANLGAAFVLHDEPGETDPISCIFAGDLLWAIANAFADDESFFKALDRYVAATVAMRRAGAPPEMVREHALSVAGRCLGLHEAGASPAGELLDIAHRSLAEIDQADAGEPDVVRIRFAVARLAGDRAELAVLVDPSFSGRDALTREQLREGETAVRMREHDDWHRALGPFTAPIYAQCLDVSLLESFTLFGLLGPDDDLPSVGPGYQCMQVGKVTLAERGCDEVSARIRLWGHHAIQASEAFLVDGQRRIIERAVPTAAMHSMSRFTSSPVAEIPEAIAFLLECGRQAAAGDLIDSQIANMLAYFEGLQDSEAGDICAAILVGVMQVMLPSERLGTYITLLETGASHDASLRQARQNVPITAPLPVE